MGKIEQLYQHFLKAGKVSTDNRTLEKGDIFFALKGPNFDGNKFAVKAIEDGASLAVVDDESLKDKEQCFLVEDVLSSLQALANYHRNQLNIPVLGITGSNGKTTTKELINAVLSEKYNVLATKGNLNNHIGVPLTLLSIKPEHEFAIIEMGANHIGEIAVLSQIAEPAFGIITNIGEAHLEGFGSIEGVLRGKTELYEFISEKGELIFVNAEDSKLMKAGSGIKQVTYGKLAGADFKYIEIEDSKFSGITTSGANIISNLVGHYNATNIAAAATIGLHFGLELSDITRAVANYKPGNHRSQMKQTEHNELILDTYNANPSSMTAAILEFTKETSLDKLAILGDMFELGDHAQRKHAEIVSLLINQGLNAILVGEQFHAVAGHFPSYTNTTDLIEDLKKQGIRNKEILIKGSRGMKLEELIPYL